MPSNQASGSSPSSAAAAAAATHGWSNYKSVPNHAATSSFSMAAATAALTRSPTSSPRPSSRPRLNLSAPTSDSETSTSGHWSLSAAHHVSTTYLSKTSRRPMSTTGTASGTTSGISSGKSSTDSSAAQALRAATAAHAPYTRSDAINGIPCSHPFDRTPRSMYSTSVLPSSHAAGAAADYADQSHQDKLHAAALAMAQTMFAEQVVGGKRPETIHEQAQRRVREQLAKMDDDMGFYPGRSQYLGSHHADKKKKSKEMRNSKFSLLSRFTGPKEKGQDNDGSDNASVASSDEEPEPSSRKRSSRGTGSQQQPDQAALIDIARRNVAADLAIMDDSAGTFDYGRFNKATELAARRKLRRENVDAPLPSAVGRDNYHVGGGKMVPKSEVTALANENLQPLFEEIEADAKKQKEAREKAEAEAAAKKKETEADKARKGKLAEIGSIFSSQKRAEEKAKKQAEKEQAKETKAAEKQLKSEVKEARPIVKQAVAGAATGAAATDATYDIVAGLPAKAKAADEEAAQEAEDRAISEQAGAVEAVSLVSSVSEPVMSSTVSPDELSAFPAIPYTDDTTDANAASLSPINELRVAPLENITVAPGAAVEPYHYGERHPQALHGTAPPLTVTDEDDSRQSLVEASTESQLHPLQSNPPMVEADAGVNAEAAAAEHATTAPGAPGKQTAAPVQAIAPISSSSNAQNTSGASAPLKTGPPAAAVGAVGRGPSAVPRSCGFDSNGYVTNLAGPSTTTAGQPASTTVEAETHQLADPVHVVQRYDIEIPPESGSSAADKVRLWFLARRRKDVSEAGRIDISDMVVSESTGATAQGDANQKKRRSLFAKLTGKDKEDGEKGFVHKPKPKGKGKEESTNVPSVPKSIESRFKEEISQ